MEMLPLIRARGEGVAHSFNCTPCLSDMRLADALVSVIVVAAVSGAKIRKNS